MTTPTSAGAELWLLVHPAPIDRVDVPAWQTAVRTDLGSGSVDELLWLLEHADMEIQFQAMSALRSLGAEVWAEGSDPDLCWAVRLPGDAPEAVPRRIKPEHQLEG